MSRLVLSLDGQVLAEYNMNKERYTIGRLPDNDIRIDNAAVSGHHSLIINILNDSFLEDLNSTNGTYVNGKLIKKHALQHGDVITVGQHQLRFVEVDEQQEEFEKTMVIDSTARAAIARQAAAAQGQADGLERSRGSDADRSLRLAETHARVQPESAVPPTRPASYGSAADEGFQRTLPDVSSTGSHRAPPPGAQPVRMARLQVLSGAFAGRELELNKALTTLGRPGIQVAAITRRPEGFFIVQVENKTPGDSPLLNGTPIGAQAKRLNDNDVIQLAGVKMGFFEG